MKYFFIMRAGVYSSVFSEYRQNELTNLRTVNKYEIELFTDDYSYGIINGQPIAYKKNTVVITHPGDKRLSRCHFSCHYLHIIAPDTETKAVLDSLPNCITVSDLERYLNIFERISHLFALDNKETGLEATGLFLLLLSYLKTDYEKTDKLELKSSSSGKDIVSVARNFIDMNYSNNITLADIAASVHLTPNYFHNLFTSVSGTTPLVYLTDIRIMRAKQLLRTTTMSVTDIASKCGFSSYSYFGSVFKKNTGVTPSNFRKNHIKKHML